MYVRHRIVAEITRNWPDAGKPLISKQFELVISENLLRGYDLESWQFQITGLPSPGIVETIIAVFVKKWDPETGEGVIDS